MPVPKPHEGESEADFTTRCMSDDAMQEYESDQRRAICASAWKRRDFSLPTHNFEGVELLAPGKWYGRGCPPDGCEFTTKHIDQAVAAYEDTKDLFDAPVKLGHNGNQKLLEEDGYPAAGWVTNLRRVGDRLVGDLMNVPRKVADLIEAGAYRKRSSEFREDFEINGKKHPIVFVGLALLGADLPAVEGLSDIHKLYSRVDLALDEGTKIVMSEDDDPILSLELELDKWMEKAKPHFKGRVGSPALQALHQQLLEGFSRNPKNKPKSVDEWAHLRPDTSFAYVAPGGRHDDGVTRPEVLRYFLHHDERGAVDVALLKNSLRQVSSMPISAGAKAQAIRHLEAHAQRIGLGEALIRS